MAEISDKSEEYDGRLPHLRVRQSRRLPRLPSHLVPRPRLLSQLDSGTALTVVRAPLGFGKTTLVLQWLQARPHEQAVWMTVTSDSADSEGFWWGLLDALDDAGFGPRGQDRTRSPRAQVRRALTTSREALTLVIDAFERVSADGIDRDLLDILRAGHDLRLIVCLRSHRSFAAYRTLDLDTTVITPTELLLTVEETSALLDSVGLMASAERAEAIHVDGGGWVEPTRAFAIAQCNSAAAATGSPTDQDAATEVAATYLRQRILPVIEPAQVSFALATSLVDGLSLELAELLAGGSAETQLEQLLADGVLFATEESGQPVYRWPPAARRAMSAELHRRAPDLARDLHGRIAGWYLARGQARKALVHAVSARDWELTVRVIERHWRELLMLHRDALFAALSATPLTAVAGSPRALAVRDLRMQHPDDRVLSVIPTLPEGHEQLHTIGQSEEAIEVLETGLAMVAMLRRRGLLARARDLSDRLEVIAGAARATRTRELNGMLPSFLHQIGITRLLADDLPGALGVLHAAYDDAALSLLTYVQADIPGKLALALALAGEAKEADVWLQRHQDARKEEGWVRRRIDNTAGTARALLALERLDLDQASEAIESIAGDPGTEEFWAFATYTRAMIALYQGDVFGGLRAIDRARASYPTWWGEGTTARVLLASVEADLLLALGRGNQARAALRAGGIDHPWLRVNIARLLLNAGRPQEALDEIARTDWARRAERRQHLDMLLVEAVAYHRLGQPEAAADALGRTLSAAEASGSRRAFATVPRDELLMVAARLPARRRSWLGAAGLDDHPYLYPEPVELVELTDREQLVLQHLAAGARVHEIAAHLYVSVNTIKTHLRSIYGKLGAANRRDAVANARRLGLFLDA